MWTLTQITYSSGEPSRIYPCDGLPLLQTKRGGLNSPVTRLMVSSVGYIDILDTVPLDEPNDSGQSEGMMIVNGSVIHYTGEANITIAISPSLSFNIIVDDLGPRTISLKSLPDLTGRILRDFSKMLEKKLVPYLNPPTPCVPKTNAELEELAKIHFPNDPMGFEKSMALYDWTSASFIRQDVFHQLQYTSVEGSPLDLKKMAEVIWGCSYPGFTHADKNFMNMFGLAPPQTEEELYDGLVQVSEGLKPLAISEMLIYAQAVIDLPWPKVSEYPQLFRGAMSMSGGYDTSDFSPSMFEFPGNAGPTSQPLVQHFDEALEGILSCGSIITTKGPWSFSNDKAGAEVWQNGILITLNPPEGAFYWPGCSDITAFSINPGTFEIDMPPPTRYRIDAREWIKIKEKPVCHFTMTLLGYCAEPMVRLP